MFNKKAEICVAILDDRLFFVFLLLYQWNKARHLWDIRTFSRDLEKKWRYLEKKNQEFPETYLADISWYLYAAVAAGIY